MSAPPPLDPFELIKQWQRDDEKSEAVQEWSYRNKVILAPMVRISTLPMRILGRHYGADIVYSEELIDKKLIKCKRVVDPKTGLIHFFEAGKEDRDACFITYPGERMSLQMGTASGPTALQAAQVVCKDVRAIDINMGCPKHFSIQGGMGASLLTAPDRVKDILTTLVNNLGGLPVTCKIRLLPKAQDTVDLIKLAQSCGVAAVAVHARRREDRPRHRALLEELRPVIEALGPCQAQYEAQYEAQGGVGGIVGEESAELPRAGLPIIYNGDVFRHADIAAAKRATGACSVMIARGAQWNPSIFSKQELPLYRVCNDYFSIASKLKNNFQNSKYAMMEMIKGHVGRSPHYQLVARSKDYDAFKIAFELMREDAALSGPYSCPLKEFSPRPPPGATICEAAPGAAVGHGPAVRMSKGDRKRENKRRRKAERKAKRTKLAVPAALVAPPSTAPAAPAAAPAVTPVTAAPFSTSASASAPASAPEPPAAAC